MDAAKVGERKEVGAGKFSLNRDVIWDSAYFEPDRWVADMAKNHYDLDSEYDVDENTLLYRFRLDDEAFRGDVRDGAPLYSTVILHRPKPPKDGKKAV